MYKWMRIVILAGILLVVWSGVNSQKDISQSWIGTADVLIIPINADGKSQAYIDTLSSENFREIEDYFDQQIKRYKPNHSHVIDVELDEQINESPPAIPTDRSNTLSIIMWSLKLRLWMWLNKPANYHSHQIRLYVLYTSPAENVVLPHSTGLQNGLVGIIHARAFKKNQRFNNLVIAHELMHVFGATDKYDLSTGKAIHPLGYANINAFPNTLQKRAEIMGRTIPLGNNRHQVATDLRRTSVNPITAKEIGWRK